MSGPSRSSPYLVDTTLRDGEQAPGVVFSHRDQRLIAQALSQAGVREIELPTPAMGWPQVELFRDLLAMGLASRLTLWCRTAAHDLSLACEAVAAINHRQAGTGSFQAAVHLSVPASRLQLDAMGKNRRWMMDQLHQLVPQAAGAFGFVSVGLADASRSEIGWLRVVARELIDLGAHRLRLADTVGVWDPWSVTQVVSELRQTIGGAALELGIHVHNDLGLATANTLAALRAGVDCADVTVNGLGERAGNAALEQVVLAAALLLGMDLGIVQQRLAALCDQVAQASGRPLPLDKPIVGWQANRHESGIHVQGMLQDPRTFQPFDPVQVGRGSWEVVLGKHSGSAAVRHAFAQQGVELSKEQSRTVLEKLRQLAQDRGGPLTAEEWIPLGR